MTTKIPRDTRSITSIVAFAGALALGGCDNSPTTYVSPSSGGTTSAGGGDAGGAGNATGGVSQATDSDGGVELPDITPGKIDPRAFGTLDASKFVFSAFSQVPTNLEDPQVLDLAPDLLLRAWAHWDNWGAKPSDYDFSYASDCHAKGVTFIGGNTASALFADEVSSEEFLLDVSRDASGNPVSHPELPGGAATGYRGSLGSPSFRKHVLYNTEFQIDGGVDGMHFDEVLGSYTGSNFVGGNEGFDDYQVADFGAYLCNKYANSLATLTTDRGVTAADNLDCTGPSGGRDFDYRGYLARHGAQGSPLSASLNPLATDWGTTTNNRPDPAKGTFLETYPPLVYWQQMVLALRTYARERLGREIFVSANGIFPFVDFQTVGLYDGNIDGPGGASFDWVPLKGSNLDGTVSFKTVLQGLKARSKRIVEGVGGKEVPIALFLDWPTASIDRYYGLSPQQRQDYFRLYAAETYALGMMFAMPLATTTDTNTATLLGMMDFFKQLKGYYKAHADAYLGSQEKAGTPAVSAPNVTTILDALPDGRTVLHIVNHNYSAGVVTQSGVTASFPLSSAPTSVTMISPDFTADKTPTYDYAAGSISVAVGDLGAYVAIVVK